MERGGRVMDRKLRRGGRVEDRFFNLCVGKCRGRTPLVKKTVKKTSHLSTPTVKTTLTRRIS